MTDALPETMTVIDISTPGGPEVLVPAQRPVPRPGPGEYLIKVAAAGLNGADISQREGRYPMPPGAPDILGLEVSGTVVAAGPGASRWKVGDALCALVAGGGYAEYCLAPRSQCLPIPHGLDLVQAASLPEVVMTVWINVFEHGALKPGETLLVHGGSSGIGTTAIQLAHRLGARVLATAGTRREMRRLHQARRGAGDRLSPGGFRRRDQAGHRRPPASTWLLDMVGAPVSRAQSRAAQMNGRVVMIAMLGGVKTEIDLRAIQASTRC